MQKRRQPVRPQVAGRRREPIRPQMPVGNGPPGNGNGDQAILDQLTLDSFTADPSTILACSSETTTLSWQVTGTPATRNVRFFLESSGFYMPVASEGTLSVPLTTPTSFGLVASLRRASQVLGEVSIIAVDNPACFPLAVSEDQVRSVLQQAIADFVAGTNGHLRLRSPVSVSIDTNGVVIKVYLVVPGTVDVNLDINARVLPLVDNCALRLTLADFGVSADLPWWLNLFFPIIVQIVEAVIANEVDGQLRPLLLQVLQDQVNALLPANFCVCQVQSALHELDLTVCPK